LVILLHGFCATGNAVFWLAKEWSAALPNAVFVAPFAPDKATLMGSRQWFPLSVRNAEERWKGVNYGAPVLRDFINAELRRYNLTEASCALAGFSQGAEMALHVGLRWPKPFAGLLAYSGMVPGVQHLSSEIRSRPPVLLIHGNLDGVIPIAAFYKTRNALVQEHVDVISHVAYGLGHQIDRQGAQIGTRFLKSVLPEGGSLL
jgi:phospholipase/carboxylesterase